MRVVYEARDGKTFVGPEECLRHEEFLDEIDFLGAWLGPTNIQAGQYRQHTHEKINAFRQLLWAKIVRVFGDREPKWRETDALSVHPGSIVGRVLGDTGSPLKKLWFRLQCINLENNREYEQPYYASHPSEATKEVP